MREYRKILRNREARIVRRLRRKQWCSQVKPMMSGGNIHYEMSGKAEAITCGGIGAFHHLVRRVGLVKEIDRHLHLLKVHLPYHESDHVLNIAYNALVGGQRLEDIELRRQDATFLNALGAQRLPDPTTAGDFTRRFRPSDIETLMDCINRVRTRIWKKRARGELKEALIDIDGTLATTLGERKQGMALSYNGIWGYHPLVVSLTNTREVLFLVNRPGNVPSHDGAVKWIDRAIALVAPFAKRICLRGDTDFSLTRHFDRWSEKVDFVFGMDAYRGLVKIAKSLSQSDWEPFERQPKYQVKTSQRQKRENVKARIIRERGFKNIRLASERVAGVSYRPARCRKTCRLVILEKNLSVERGENALFDDKRYFFYITTRKDLTAAEIVRLANRRCDQENVIEQLKNGVNAMRMPVDNLMSNWAYMVMTALAWNLKAWFALMIRKRERRDQLLRMEFRAFLQNLIWIPCQIVTRGRQIIYRVLGYNRWMTDFFPAWNRIRWLKPA